MYYLFELSSCDPKIKDCYVGYTRDYESFFNMHIDSKENEENKKFKKVVVNGKEKIIYEKQTPLSQFVEEHGGWENWEYFTLKEFDDDELEDVKVEKETLLLLHPKKYTINIYGHPTNMRIPRVLKKKSKNEKDVDKKLKEFKKTGKINVILKDK